MKSKLFLSTLLLLLLKAFPLSSQNLFSKTYGSTNYDAFHAVCATADNGYIMTGLTLSYGDTLGDAIIVKTDSAGNTQFLKIYGGAKVDGGNAILQTADGGYLVVGHSESFSSDCDGIVLKLNANGDSIWERIYGSPDDDAFSAADQTADGGFIFAGHSENFSAIACDAFLVKTDNNGNVQWQKYLGGAADQTATSIKQTADGGYIIAGRTTITGTDDVLLIKTNINGDTIWTKTFGGADNERAYCVNSTSDGGYIITGGTRSFGAGAYDFYLIKTDASGNSQWQQTFGGAYDDGAYDVKQTADGGYIVTGFTKSFGDTLGDIYLVKTDLSGNVMWTKVIGGGGDDGAISVLSTSDGGYAIAGHTKSFGNGDYDCFLVKTDSVGFNVTSVNDWEPVKDFSVFPNPSNGIFTVASQKEIITIEIYTVLGECVYKKDASTPLTMTIDLSEQSKGIYFVQIKSGDNASSQKIIIQ